MHLNILVLGIDGANSKNSHCNGVFLSLFGFDGSFEIIDAGFAMLLKETNENYNFFSLVQQKID
jgi:hypothetical protein